MSTLAPEPFETLGYVPPSSPRAEATGLVRLEAHLARLARACSYLGIDFSAQDARAHLVRATAAATGPLRVRLLVTTAGELRVTVATMPPAAAEPLLVGVAFERIDESDPLRRHKTTARQLYDQATQRAAELGLADIVFLNRRGAVAEGAISNVFDEVGGRLVTPPVTAGALPGVLRGELLASGQCVEGELRLEDLEAGGFVIGSSLRGLRRAVLAPGLVVVAADG